MIENSELIRKVKEALDIRESNGNISESELYRLLEKTRNNYHPDKTTNPETQQVYTEKFTNLTELLKELGEYISNRPLKSPTDLVKYDREHVERIELKHEIVLLNEKLDLLKSELKRKEAVIEELNSSIRRLRDVKISEESKKLLELYKPKRINFYRIGLVAFLGLFLNILLQVESISQLFAKYMPFLNESNVIYFTLGTIIFFTFIVIQKYLQERYINNLLDKAGVWTFQKKIFSGGLYSFSFDERELIDRLVEEIEPKSKLNSFYLRKMLRIDFDIVIENLKNIIIYHLLNKDMIEPNGFRNFAQGFKSKEK